jgi:hypothetical protein
LVHSKEYNCYSVNQQMHTVCYNYNNILVGQILHFSGLTGPSSGSAQLHKTIYPYYHLQYVAALS